MVTKQWWKTVCMKASICTSQKLIFRVISLTSPYHRVCFKDGMIFQVPFLNLYVYIYFLAKIFDYGIMECQFDKILGLNLKSKGSIHFQHVSIQ
jgi:hypothetical protein